MLLSCLKWKNEIDLEFTDSRITNICCQKQKMFFFHISCLKKSYFSHKVSATQTICSFNVWSPCFCFYVRLLYSDAENPHFVLYVQNSSVGPDPSGLWGGRGHHKEHDHLHSYVPHERSPTFMTSSPNQPLNFTTVIRVKTHTHQQQRYGQNGRRRTMESSPVSIGGGEAAIARVCSSVCGVSRISPEPPD